MIRLQDKDTGAHVGDITEDQLQFLISQLEEESEDDRDYYINRTTVDSFEEQNADPDLVETLRNALGGREEMEIQWTRQQ
jgi:hypothetical protein